MEIIILCPLLCKNWMAWNKIELEILILQMNKIYYLVNIYFYLTLILRGRRVTGQQEVNFPIELIN